MFQYSLKFSGDVLYTMLDSYDKPALLSFLFYGRTQHLNRRVNV